VAKNLKELVAKVLEFSQKFGGDGKLTHRDLVEGSDCFTGTLACGPPKTGFGIQLCCRLLLIAPVGV
jgi:hypothetical protein